MTGYRNTVRQRRIADKLGQAYELLAAAIEETEGTREYDNVLQALAAVGHACAEHGNIRLGRAS